MSGSGAEPAAPLDHVGFVAVVGRPNVGKSTLVNALVGEHVSITSRKPQTTRQRVLGVLTRPDAQVIFTDTPGFQRKHRNKLTDRMNESVGGALREADAIVLVIDAAGWTDDDRAVLALLPRAATNVLLVLNKCDLLRARDALLPLIEQSMQLHPFRAVVPLSAQTGAGTEALLAELLPLLPAGVPLYDADQYTDRPARFMAAELIREKAYRLLGEELPYGLAVTIERWEETDTLARIAATIVVERDSHKPILIGKGGSKLKEISTAARLDIERMLDRKVFLEIWVRVRRNWSDDVRALRALGYDH